MGALATMAGAQANAQRIAVPSYIYPGAAWTSIENGAPTVGIAIINPNSGPGTSVDANYQTQVKEAQAHGIKVLGYVATSYGKRDAKAVEAEIDAFDKWYAVDGILLDEVASSPDKLPYYGELHSYIVKLHPHALTVINPGNQTDEGYLKVADVILTFEGSYSEYVEKYNAPAWVAHYPSNRFWHVVYDTPADQMKDAVRLSKSRNAGWVYVTPRTMPNPYGELPGTEYWSAEIKAVR
jgi:hypothetical protein